MIPAPGLYPWITQLIGSGQALAWEGSLTGVEGFIWADHILPMAFGAGRRLKCHLEGAHYIQMGAPRLQVPGKGMSLAPSLQSRAQTPNTLGESMC